MRSFIVTTTDGRQFPVSAFSREHAIRQMLRATYGRGVVESVREVR